MEKVLASAPFRNSRRCQSLLRYVVESNCRGLHESLKERVIGSAVFGRDADYDTNQDAVVRNAAAEVRKRLAQYYLELGHEGELRIELPAGSYVPDYHEPQAAPVAMAPVQAPAKQPRWLVFSLAAVEVCVACDV
jgi:hypothetical protein